MTTVIRPQDLIDSVCRCPAIYFLLPPGRFYSGPFHRAYEKESQPGQRKDANGSNPD